MKKFILFFNLLITAYAFGQVGINTANPHASALLDVDATSLPKDGKKGFLGPRVDLLSAKDTETIKTPAEGLLVYNLGNGGLSPKGYYFWDGAKWIAFGNGNGGGTPSLPDGKIGAIDCNKITYSGMIPNPFQAGKPFEGYMYVSYTGGNGGTYPEGKPIASGQPGSNEGITATLQAGTLANGNGVLVYKLSGTPINGPGTGLANKFYYLLQFPGQGGTIASCAATFTGLDGDVPFLGNVDAYFGTVLYSEWVTKLGHYYVSLLPSLTPPMQPMVEGIMLDLKRDNTNYYTVSMYNTTASPIIVNYQAWGGAGYSGISNRVELDPLSSKVYDIPRNFILDASHNGSNTGTLNIIINNRWYQAEFYTFRDWYQNIPKPDEKFNIRISVQRIL